MPVEHATETGWPGPQVGRPTLPCGFESSHCRNEGWRPLEVSAAGGSPGTHLNKQGGSVQWEKGTFCTRVEEGKGVKEAKGNS